ncbi:hypothetical protein ANSO36C_68440 (plasmid) [Nostoc cf. commune SO-36]|uniref:Uncharacterized protein n=1 Tax=Nostoc cf. commune SO-36 TaxID=449208 RepID=A0ABM7ZCI7_NOSCO|nr:hypothetical protein [Nostoc commune]BDI21042.1 hypothetical protein ANSO36C_68440 [Nostoc cf. commune SO-36]
MLEENPIQSVQESSGAVCKQTEDIVELDTSLTKDVKLGPLSLTAITLNWGRNRISDCEWRETYLNLYNDGRYEGNVNLRCNKGAFFTCTLATSFKIYVGQTVVAVLDAPTKEVAGADDKNAGLSGFSRAIADYFDQITSAGRVQDPRNC